MSDDRKWMRRVGTDTLQAQPDSNSSIEVTKRLDGGGHVLTAYEGDCAVRLVFPGDDFRDWMAASARYVLGMELAELKYPEIEEDDVDIPF